MSEQFSKDNPMFYVDIPKLRGAMAEKGYNKTTFAKALGIGRDTLDRYMKDPERMPYGVMLNMAHLLFEGRAAASLVFMCCDWARTRV